MSSRENKNTEIRFGEGIRLQEFHIRVDLEKKGFGSDIHEKYDRP